MRLRFSLVEAGALVARGFRALHGDTVGDVAVRLVIDVSTQEPEVEFSFEPVLAASASAKENRS